VILPLRVAPATPSSSLRYDTKLEGLAMPGEFTLIQRVRDFAPGAWTTLKAPEGKTPEDKADEGKAPEGKADASKAEKADRKLYLFDAKKIMAPTFGAVRGKKLGEVVSAGPEGLRIHAQGGFIEVSRLRLGDGAKVKSTELDIPVGTILGGSRVPECPLSSEAATFASSSIPTRACPESDRISTSVREIARQNGGFAPVCPKRTITASIRETYVT